MGEILKDRPPREGLELLRHYLCCISCGRYAKKHICLTVNIEPALPIASGSWANWGGLNLAICQECLLKTEWLSPRQQAEMLEALKSDHRLQP